MANKIFSYYKPHDTSATNEDSELVVEAGNTHFACLAIGTVSRNILAFEWFKHHRSDLASFEELIVSIQSASRLLDNKQVSARAFINNGSAILIPPDLYTEAAAKDYLDLVTGESVLSETLHDTINEGDGYVNAFRVPTPVIEVLRKHFGTWQVEHTFSQTLRHMLRDGVPPESMLVQFYDSEINVTVFRQGRLQLMQNFTYTLADDVLYYLLSLAQRFHLDFNQLQVRVCGMIDTHSALYAQLLRFFKQVSTYNNSVQLPGYSGDHPSHYFTPIFNLVS